MIVIIIAVSIIVPVLAWWSVKDWKGGGKN